MPASNSTEELLIYKPTFDAAEAPDGWLASVEDITPYGGHR
jgi:hypothetical protein